jgi:hypothetical protein
LRRPVERPELGLGAGTQRVADELRDLFQGQQGDTVPTFRRWVTTERVGEGGAQRDRDPDTPPSLREQIGLHRTPLEVEAGPRAQDEWGERLCAGRRDQGRDGGPDRLGHRDRVPGDRASAHLDAARVQVDGQVLLQGSIERMEHAQHAARNVLDPSRRVAEHALPVRAVVGSPVPGDLLDPVASVQAHAGPDEDAVEG